jgi:hypothetical protein
MSASVTATHEEEDKASTTQKKTRGSDQKVVSNVSVEEWDCPQPGKRKYMPRQVKANIRKNFEKINAARKEQADSLAAVQRRK